MYAKNQENPDIQQNLYNNRSQNNETYTHLHTYARLKQKQHAGIFWTNQLTHEYFTH